MTIKTLPCTTCVHTEVCNYKEKYVNYIMEVYPAVPSCDLYKSCSTVTFAGGGSITLYSK
jgi:hypothetical protein